MPRKNFNTAKYQNEIRDRIRTNSKLNKDTGCWVWQGTIMKNGYGHMRFRGGDTTVHRISYIVFNGEIESHMIVRHKCHK